MHRFEELGGGREGGEGNRREKEGGWRTLQVGPRSGRTILNS